MSLFHSGVMRLFLVGCALTLAQGTAVAGSILLSDDFNDNSLDSSKWFTVLPFGTSSVLEQNQRLELTNRGYLVTQSQFNPTAIGGLRIRGQYTFLDTSPSTFDFLQIVTRTAAVPTSPFGEASQGLSFTIRGDGQLRVHDRTTGATLVGPVPIAIGNNETFDFEVRDDGSSFSFVVQEVGGAGASASLSGISSINSTVNHVAFYNREFDTGYLDNVELDVAPVPEPSSLILAACGVVGVAGMLRRRPLVAK